MYSFSAVASPHEVVGKGVLSVNKRNGGSLQAYNLFRIDCYLQIDHPNYSSHEQELIPMRLAAVLLMSIGGLGPVRPAMALEGNQWALV
jgi:hypothetical protein